MKVKIKHFDRLRSLGIGLIGLILVLGGLGFAGYVPHIDISRAFKIVLILVGLAICFSGIEAILIGMGIYWPKISLTWLLPNDLVKGQRFRRRWEKRIAKSEAFAKCFGIDQDSDSANRVKGAVLSKKEAFDTLEKKVFKKKKSRLVKEIILRFGLFMWSSCGWSDRYEFERIRNGKTKFQLAWHTELP